MIVNKIPTTSLGPAAELTSEHAYTRALTVALLQTLGPKKAQRLIGHLAAAMAEQVSRAEVVPIRGDRQRHEREGLAKLEAARAFEADLPTLLHAACGSR